MTYAFSSAIHPSTGWNLVGPTQEMTWRPLPAKNAQESAASSSSQDLEQAQLASTESLQRGRNVEAPEKKHRIFRVTWTSGHNFWNELSGSACVKLSQKTRRCCQLHLLRNKDQRPSIAMVFIVPCFLFSILSWSQSPKLEGGPYRRLTPKLGTGAMIYIVRMSHVSAHGSMLLYINVHIFKRAYTGL